MAFATSDDVAEQWRPLSAAETVRADALLTLAEILIRRHVDIPVGDPLEETAKQVSIEMVIEAIDCAAHRGEAGYTRAIDGASYSATLKSSDGGSGYILWLSPGLRDLLGLTSLPEPQYYFGDCPQ